ncbi:hypothetical protein BG011_006074 [Mortierella polycephala]|uniref:Uncharacterized protein n=1 Tax=Mortierella polycephala TaxID=41804 RepID=A0A9P6U871_9FUNG|nr:hypothetical protein BG011_006074 [Mortierella polycephala]
MAMMDQCTVKSYFRSTHARVDSKFHSDSSSEKVDEANDTLLLQRPVSDRAQAGGGGGLRRCAATRDLTSIRSTVNYCAKVSVSYMVGDPSTPFHIRSWEPLSMPESSTNTSDDEVSVDNLETVRRFKKTLYSRVCPIADEGFEGSWPELFLYRRKDDSSLEAIDGDQEALYMFALKDGDQVVLLVRENGANNCDSSRCGSGSAALDPVAQWVEAIRAQTEFEAVEA